MEENAVQMEIQKLEGEIIDKKKRLEELIGRQIRYTKKGQLDMRSLRIDDTNQQKFKEYNKQKREALKKAKLEELEIALDNQLKKTLESVIQRKKVVEQPPEPQQMPQIMPQPVISHSMPSIPAHHSMGGRRR